MPIPAGPDIDPAELPPEHSVQVGDVRQPTLVVTAADGTPGSTTADPPTAATCTVTAPGSVPATLAVSTPDGGATWNAAPYVCTPTAGRWVETWTVTGTSADVLYTVVLVHAAPTSGGQTWIPTREQVAAYIPRRTHVGATTGWGVTQNTFSELTNPSKDSVDSLITQAAQWIELLAGPIVTVAASEAATTAAAMRVAGWIQLQWGDTPEDAKQGERLLAEAEKLRKDVAAANVVETGVDPTLPAVVMPVWSFPAATELWL